MYGGYAWLTNIVRHRDRAARTVLLSGMAAFLVVSLAVPRAFGPTRSPSAGRICVPQSRAHRRLPDRRRQQRHGDALGWRREPRCVRAASIAAGYARALAHWALWLAAVLVQWTSAAAVPFDPRVRHRRRALRRAPRPDDHHRAGRVAGQRRGGGARAPPVTAALVVGVAVRAGRLGRHVVVLLRRRRRARDASVRGRHGSRRGRVALVGYDLPHVLMMAGVVAVAAGSRLSLPELTDATDLARPQHSSPAARRVYLAATRRIPASSLGYGRAVPRLVAGAVMLAVIPLGTHARCGPGVGRGRRGHACSCSSANRGGRPAPCGTAASGRMSRMTDPRTAVEFRVPAVELRPGDLVNTTPGEDDWQEVVGGLPAAATDAKSNEIRSLVGRARRALRRGAAHRSRPGRRRDLLRRRHRDDLRRRGRRVTTR